MRTLPTIAIVLGLSLLTVSVAAAFPGPHKAFYEGPGVVVTEVNAEGLPTTLADTGAVICDDVDNDGTPDKGHGGTCIPFTKMDDPFDPGVEFYQDSIYVRDKIVPDQKLAFQVCVDINGDNKCTFTPGEGGVRKGSCEDVIFFSHESRTGANHNPLFVDPWNVYQEFQNCNAGGFPGYIVMTCAGLHVHGHNPQTSHEHKVTEGSASTAWTDGTPQGDFCGAPQQEKAYAVI